MASITNGALLLTPDLTPNTYFNNRVGRVLYNRSFTLWDGDRDSPSVASFNTTFLINMYPLEKNDTGEGMAFIIAPDLTVPTLSDGRYLGLTNPSADGKATNRLLAIEFDSCRDDTSDPDGNHIGVNINSIHSKKTVSLSNFNITLAPINYMTIFHKVWIHYDGHNKTLAVYIADLSEQYQRVPMPESPVLTVEALDLSSIVNKESFIGFSASNGAGALQLNSVLSWNITIEVIEALGGGGGQWKAIMAGVAVLAALVLAAIGWIWVRMRRRAKMAEEPNILGALKLLPGTPREFGFRALKKATGNFDQKNRLGQGGYGVVFRGVLPTESAEVAVKKFTREDNVKSKYDFLSELTIINRLRHRHLVKLLGWCHKKKMLLLVYEYMPNGSLDTHIFCGEGQTPISWNFRYNILRGVASALQYLHHEYEDTVIHRDLKASNIMLDASFNARLGDFGLARALEQEKTSYIEMEGIHGTMGYIAPECFHTGKATRESDIYAFGAVLLEVACGHRPWAKLGQFNCLGDWVWSHHREGRIREAVDSRLGNDYDAEEVERVLLLGLACLHPVGSERPKAQAVLQILSGLMPVPVVPPFKPAFVWPAMVGPMELDTSTDMDVRVEITQLASFESKTEWTPHTYTREGMNQYTDYSTA